MKNDLAEKRAEVLAAIRGNWTGTRYARLLIADFEAAVRADYGSLLLDRAQRTIDALNREMTQLVRSRAAMTKALHIEINVEGVQSAQDVADAIRRTLASVEVKA